MRSMLTGSVEEKLLEPISSDNKDLILQLIVAKCIVAAHIFGPRHPYCLTAILWLHQQREMGPRHHEILKKVGFQVRLSIALALNRLRK